MIKRFLSLSVLLAMLWGCCSVEDIPATEEKTASYKVEHYQQNTNDDGYTLVEADSENKNGKAGENTSVQAKTYEGFTAKTVEQVKITADGKAVVKIYYDRNEITLTLDLDGGEGENEIIGKYGATVNVTAPTKSGYDFASWNPQLPKTFPAISTTYKATWTVGNGTAYKVEHYQQNITDDEYTLADTENKTGTTDEETSAQAKTYDGFTAKTVEQVKITADGSTVVKIYYDRNTITLTLNLDGGDGETKITGKYGAAVTAPANPTKTGYTFACWNPELPTTFPAESTTYTATWAKEGDYVITYELNGGTNALNNPASYNVETATIILADATKTGYSFGGWYTDKAFKTAITEIKTGSIGAVTLYAKWNANTDTAYKVEHYQQNANDDDYTLVEADTEYKTGTTDEDTSAQAKTYENFTAQEVKQVKIAADGKAVVKIYYDRNIITLTLDLDGGSGETEIKGKYGAKVTKPTDPTKSGYEFAGWSPELPATFPTESATYTAQWAKLYTITYNLDGGKWKGGFTPVIVRNANTGILLPTADNVEKTNYVFIGWYDEYGEKVTQISGDTAKNISVTAKWGDTADTVVATINSLSGEGPYDIIVIGAITSDTISSIKTALQNNSGTKVNLDLSDTTGLTSIGDEAFRGCSSLTSIVIPDSVTSIGEGAFRSCSSLESVTIGNGVTSIGDNAFFDCSSLTSVTIPDSVTSIGDNAFFHCSSLTSVTIGNGVTSIGGYAFCDCSKLTSVVIGDSVTSIGDYPFQYCSSLTNLRIDTNNPNYSSSDDGKILYNKDKTRLIAYPSATGDVTIPDSVTSIGDEAFFCCSSLESIVIPDSVTSIGGSAFSGCSSLTSVTIPDSVTSIGGVAFSGCSSLTTVNYKGTQEQWGQISIGSYNGDLTSATINYNYTE